jgi:uncharacterized protein YjdB
MKKIGLFPALLAALLAFAACPSPTGGGGGGGGTPVNTVAVTGVSLKVSIGLVIGSTETLTVAITPSNATNKKVTWGSSNDMVAAVSTGGVVTGVSEGTAVITVTTADGGYQADCTVTVSSSLISVTGVSLKPAISLVTGGEETLFAIIEPANAADKAVSWVSSNDSVARVSENGLVTAVAAGTADVTVTTADGGYQASCAVTVSDTAISVTSVSLNKQSAILATGGEETLFAIIEPANATDKAVSWASSNDSVARVSESGLITAVAAGTAAVTVITADGGYQASCAVTVSDTAISVISVSMNKQSAILAAGDTETLTAVITPSIATNQNITWSSSNDNVAAVSAGGVVYAKNTGTAVITVTTSDGGKTAACGVTVNPKVITFTVDAIAAQTYTGSAIVPAVTVRDGSTVLTPAAHYTSAYTNNVNAGTAAVTISGAGNYAGSSGSRTFTINKAAGAAVSAPALNNTTQNSITVNAVAAPGSGQTVEYARNTANAAPSSGWQDSTTFSGLTAGTVYYIFARSKSNTNYNTGAASGGTSVTTGTSASVRRVFFSGPTETVIFSGLSNKDIYLVKVNTSNNVVEAANTGGRSGSSPFITSGKVLPAKSPLPRMGHPAADEFNANPPPITRVPPRSRAAFVPPVAGDTRIFWVESYYNSGTWVQKQATLRAAGQYGNIWVMDENYGSGGNKITTAQAQTLAAKFDSIYPIETNLLGYEYGGGPGGDGGKDGDPKIQILVYSIVNTSGTVQAAGFFWSKDYYDQATIDQYSWPYKTNLAEIFYIDASQVNDVPDYIYSTLVHEFQHMINFNMKSVKYGRSSESWYNEMLSMMTEDVMASHIGIGVSNPLHVIQVSIPTFLTNYEKVGITEWNTLSNISYAKGYAFGAYLMRNYGGASLLKEILANNSVNTGSVTAALKTTAGSGLSFEEALRRYGEALVFSGTMPSDVLSFDKTVAKIISSYTYTAAMFNVWNDFGSVKPMIFGSTEQV